MLNRFSSNRLVRLSFRVSECRGSALFLVVFLIILTGNQAQAQYIDKFSTTASGSQYAPVDSQPTLDGGYIVAGGSYSNGFRNNLSWILKLNSNSTIDWQKTYTGLTSDGLAGLGGFNAIQPTSDGGYVVASSRTVLKINFDGTVAWSRYYKSPTGQNDSGAGTTIGAFHSIQQTSDGGYITAAPLQCCSNSHVGIAVLKLTASGASQWTQIYGTSNLDDRPYVRQTADGGYVVAGTKYIPKITNGQGSTATDIYVSKLNSDGTLVWAKYYTAYSYPTNSNGSSDPDPCSAAINMVHQTSDGGYFLDGQTGCTNGTNGRPTPLALKLDAGGSITWQRGYGNGGGFYYPVASQPTQDGGYVLAGGADSGVNTVGSPWLLKLDFDGSIAWQRSLYPGTLVNTPDGLVSIQQTSGGGYMAASLSTNSDLTFHGAKVFNIDANGHVAGCGGDTAAVAIPLNLSVVNTSAEPLNQNGTFFKFLPENTVVESATATVGDITFTSETLCGLLPAQLEVTKTVSSNSVAVGQNLTYTITVKNKGPNAAQAVSLTDPLSSNLTFGSATSSQGTCSQSNGVVTCNIGNMAGATVTTVMIVASPNAVGNISNTASASGANSQNVQGSVSINVLPPAKTIQFSASNYTVGEGDGSAIITVTRTGDLSGTSTVDYATSDGTAKQSSDYTVTTGTLTFAANISSMTFSVPIVDDAYAEPSETVNLSLSNPVGATLGSQGTAVLTITDNDTTTVPSIPQTRFMAALNISQETPPPSLTCPPTCPFPTGTGLVLLNSNQTSGLAGLQFANLTAPETVAHIHTGAIGVAGPATFPLPTANPVTNFTFGPTASQVADLKAGNQYMNVHSTNFPNGEIRGQLLWNPTLELNFFVRQQYLDFLSREPDTNGFNFWVGEINCLPHSQGQVPPDQADVQCFHDRTIAVSDAFFFEGEFHQTAGFVFLVYRAAYGNQQPFPNPDPANPTEANKLPEYGVFTTDRARVVGGSSLTAQQQAFTNLLVTRSEFLAKYPTASFPDANSFVQAILANIQNADPGVTFTAQTQTALETQYTNAGGGNAGRAMVLYSLSLDDAANNPINNRLFVDAEYNRQFALTLYFAYLRRNPDIAGFLFWQSQINKAPVRDGGTQQGLVCSFITSGEYQARFGPFFPRSNQECPQ